LSERAAGPTTLLRRPPRRQIAYDTSETRAMVTLSINGKAHTVDVPGDMPLLWVLRDVIGLTGTKCGCGMALCGAWTVHVAGRPVRSCVTAVAAAAGKQITTIEGVGNTPSGRKVQQAWLDLDVVQCGYCQSGQIMSAAALLASKPHPTDADIDAALAGNICRCGTYVRIRAAIKRAGGWSHGAHPFPPDVPRGQRPRRRPAAARLQSARAAPRG